MFKFIKLVVLLVVVFGAIWAGGLFWFKMSIADKKIVIDRQTDAIIVLTGGSNRLKEGVDLLINNFAGRLFISGVGKGVTFSDLFQNLGFSKKDGDYLAQVEELKSRIEYGYEARNTKGNAKEVVEWVKNKNYRSIRLVTSNYHMVRSVMEIRSLMPELEIIEHTIISENVKLDDWLSFKGSRNLIINEYNKLLMAGINIEFQKRKER